MATRAAFLIGDPTDLENREWLGCIAFDGYIEGVPEIVAAKSEFDFREAVEKYSRRHDFANPSGAFPYPWDDDLFLTDRVYWWHEGQVWTEYERKKVPLFYLVGATEKDIDCLDKFLSNTPKTLCDIPAPGLKYDGSQPDSIMFLG